VAVEPTSPQCIQRERRATTAPARRRSRRWAPRIPDAREAGGGLAPPGSGRPAVYW